MSARSPNTDAPHRLVRGVITARHPLLLELLRRDAVDRIGAVAQEAARALKLNLNSGTGAAARVPNGNLHFGLLGEVVT